MAGKEKSRHAHRHVCDLYGTHCLSVIVGRELIWLKLCVESRKLTDYTVKLTALCPSVKRLLELLLCLDGLHLLDTLDFALPLLPCVGYIGVL